MGVICKPELLRQNHQIEAFDCGRGSLNKWLNKQALRAQASGASRTYVVCDDMNRVLGFYALAPGAVKREDAPGRVKKNMPNPIPVLLLGRLTVDQSLQGKGVGSSLLKDALLRAVSGAEVIGGRAVLLHALDDSARQFYLKQGFYESPTNSMTLMLTVEEIKRLL